MVGGGACQDSLGSFLAPDQGMLLLRFDNSFSWINGKSVELRLEQQQGEAAQQQQATQLTVEQEGATDGPSGETLGQVERCQGRES